MYHAKIRNGNAFECPAIMEKIYVEASYHKSNYCHSSKRNHLCPRNKDDKL